MASGVSGYIGLDQQLKHRSKGQPQKLEMLVRMAHTADSEPICERPLADLYAKLMVAIQGERMPECSHDRKRWNKRRLSANDCSR